MKEEPKGCARSSRVADGRPTHLCGSDIASVMGICQQLVAIALMASLCPKGLQCDGPLFESAEIRGRL